MQMENFSNLDFRGEISYPNCMSRVSSGVLNMKKLIPTLVCLSFLCGVSSQGTSLVYDNTTGDLNFRFDPQNAEVGDQIVLAGTDRIITRFVFQYYGLNFTGDEQARLRFYENDGALSTSGFAMPGSLRYDSGFFNIPQPTSTRNSATLTFLDFTTGAVVPLDGAMPNTFTWSVEFLGIGAGEQAGLDLFSPPDIGFNWDWYWVKDGGVWNTQIDPGGVPISFLAQVEAVPEPAAIHLLLGGFIAFGAWRIWRRKRNS
jgi:hypothetical protein